ncbi:hypothetical protein NKH18_01640 [Streptomyces sp. M10(2022)]
MVLYIVLGVIAGGFLSADNQLGILRDAATVGIPALGVTLVIIAGRSTSVSARPWPSPRCSSPRPPPNGTSGCRSRCCSP